jgi:putative DNA primase/helicase
MRLDEALRNPLDAALTYAERGWPIFPVHGIDGGRCTCGKPNCDSPGKHPLTKKGFKAATTDTQQIREWFVKRPKANLATTMGTTGNGHLGIDADPRHGGDKTFLELTAELGPLPRTLVTLTGGGGTHHWFPCRGVEFRSKANALGPGLDLKAGGGYLLLPPSAHISGGVYRWQDYSVAPADLPRAWEQFLLNPPKQQKAETAGKVNGAGDKIPDSERNVRLTSLAGSMRRRGMTPDEIFAALLVVNAQRCVPPLREEEVRTIAFGVGTRYEAGPVMRMGSTREDTSNGERFAEQHKESVRFACQRGKWLVWDGRRFKPDDENRTQELAKQTARSIYHESASLPEDEAVKMGRWAEDSLQLSGLRAMVGAAESDERLVVREDQLDSDPWLLTCISGTINLRTGEQREHRRTDLITRVTNAEFKADAKCPLWMKYLETTFEGDTALINFFQRVSGYTLTGNTRESAWFFLHGGGENGKSTWANVMDGLLGDYAYKASFETFTFKKQGHGIRNDLAAMNGCRFVYATETSPGQRLDDAMIKELTGDEKVTARFLYQEEFSYRPVFKLFLSANSKPAIRDTTHATWRRIRLIPFVHQISREEKIEDFYRRLLAEERDGIFAWCVAGCLAWQGQKLNPPAQVLNATDEYRSEMDFVQQFTRQRCRRGRRSASKELYDSYKGWCEEEQGLHAMTKNIFTRELKRLGYSIDPAGRWYYGIELIPFGEEESEQEGE